MYNKQDSIGITFRNYNPEFNSFFNQYKELCLKISDNKSLQDLHLIRKQILTFIFNNEYSIDNLDKRNYYHKLMFNLKEKADNDKDLKLTQRKDLEFLQNKIEYKKKYYEYFISYLKILGEFISELTTIYMPTTNIQKKLVKWANNQMFYEKFTDHRNIVIDSLSNFNINNFTEAYNKLLTFYFAYSLFINEDDRILLDKSFSYSISYYLTTEVLTITSKKEHSSNELINLSKIEMELHRMLLHSISLMNQSFSNYDVLPKIQNKVFLDRTLI